jgi:transcriptional regulator with XRE-family HTH domain
MHDCQNNVSFVKPRDLSVDVYERGPHIPVMADFDLLKKWMYWKDGPDYNQKQLAYDSGVSRGTVSLVLRGRTKPDQATIEKISRALGVTVSDFWAGPEEYTRRRSGHPPELSAAEAERSRILEQEKLKAIVQGRPVPPDPPCHA